MTTILRAWHGDPALRAATIATAEAHRAADLLRHGAIGRPSDGTPGCSVVCTVGSYDHSLYPIHLGLPEWLARMQDRIYESLPRDERHLDDEWTVDLLGCIKPGADLDAVLPRILHDILVEVALPAADSSAPVVQGVIDLLSRRIAGDEPSPDEWAAAEAAAWAAADAAARAAAGAAAEAGAWAAAEAAAEAAAWAAAEAAAWAAADVAPWAAAEAAAWERIRAITLRHLAAAPIADETGWPTHLRSQTAAESRDGQDSTTTALDTHQMEWVKMQSEARALEETSEYLKERMAADTLTRVRLKERVHAINAALHHLEEQERAVRMTPTHPDHIEGGN